MIPFKNKDSREKGVVEDDSAVPENVRCVDVLAVHVLHGYDSLRLLSGRYARFLSPLHLQSRGCRHRDIHFVFCRLSSHQPAGSPPAGGPGRTGGEKEEQKTNSGSVCGTVTMIQ